MSERLDFALELKSVDAKQRVIEGYASAWSIDDGEDEFEPGAWSVFLSGHPASEVMVPSETHNRLSRPLGIPIEIREDSHGLFTKTRIHKTSAGDDWLAIASERQAAGMPLGMSVGYVAEKFGFQTKSGRTVRKISQAALLEYSYTPIPMNGHATVTAVKAAEAKAAVDNSAWDGNAAMAACETASDYEAICAGRREGDPSLRATWALPHHKSPGADPNADGVRNSLSRLPQTQGLMNKAAAQSHLEAHMAAINPAAGKSAGRLLAIKAMSGIDPATLGAIAQLDYLIDQADDIADCLMQTFGIVDPDEVDGGDGGMMADAMKSLQLKAGRRYSSATSQMLLARLAAARKALDEIEADITAATDDGKSTDASMETQKTESISGPFDLEIALAKARGGLWA